jgi:AcrR family transcriptional regulator
MTDRIQILELNEIQPTARHERADAAANRALILQTAERLFVEKGVANVCMAEIAAAAGVGKGTLYRRFASKGELCLSLMDRQMGEFQNEALIHFREHAAQGVAYLEQLARFLEALVAFTEFHSPLLIEVQRDGIVQGDVRLNLPHFWQYTTVRALLRSAARNGEVKPNLDLDYIGEALLAPLHVDTFGLQRNVRGYSTEQIGAGLRSLVNLMAA